MTDPRLARLARIADLVRDRETTQIAALQAKVAALQAEAAKLGAGGDATEPTPFNRSGRAAAHEAWVQKERIRINRELARLRAEKEALAERVARAVARSEVIARLIAPPR